MSGSLVLANANVIRADGSIQTGCDVVVRNGVIEEVLNREERDLSCSDRSVNTWEVCDCTDCFVTPGLVNLHTHSPMTILRGIAEDVNVEEWFNRRIWPFESTLTEKDVYIGAMLGIYEMIDCGTTAFCDHYFFADKIASAAFESGIRADIAPTVFGMVPNWHEALDEASLLIENINHKWGSLVKMRIGPHAPYTCSPSVLEACAERAVELNVGIHIHVSETEKQIKDSITQYGKTPFAILKESGVLDVPCIIGHGIWIQAEELSYVGDDAVFAVCPKTYLKLSSGFGNLYRFQWERLAKDEARRLDQGNYEVSGESSCLGRLEEPLKIGVGTDGAASSNTLNPLEQVRLYGLLAKDHLGDASAYPLKSLWQMLMNGHLALSANTGDVAPGYAADLVVWDLDMVHTWPVYDPLASILYSADARNVRHVLVEGHFKKRDGKVLVCNVEELLKESQDIRDRLLTEGPKTSELKY